MTQNLVRSTAQRLAFDGSPFHCGIMLTSVHSTSSEPAPTGELPFFVCVHVGAGYHAPDDERSYRRLMNQACRRAAAVLSRNGELVDAVTDAISVLEVTFRTHGYEREADKHVGQDSDLTNAGHGANLNEAAEVECDASVMTGSGVFGAIGAAAGKTS